MDLHWKKFGRIIISKVGRKGSGIVSTQKWCQRNVLIVMTHHLCFYL